MTVKVEFHDDVQATAERIWGVLADAEHYFIHLLPAKAPAPATPRSGSGVS
jgi:hypothetical protein